MDTFGKAQCLLLTCSQSRDKGGEKPQEILESSRIVNHLPTVSRFFPRFLSGVQVGFTSPAVPNEDGSVCALCTSGPYRSRMFLTAVQVDRLMGLMLAASKLASVHHKIADPAGYDGSAPHE